MRKVHVLPPEIISKIAAGEVIERPASVIKELFENSLDAGSSSIELHLKEAGKSLIHIKDTGSGISREDIETIFQRHATSKIATIDDLFTVHSLGFRGEALYSISAISDVILRSRTAEQDTGWEIHLRGGKRLDLRPVAMPVGTEVEVQELFFNTPARRKFLKSNTTEMSQILGVVIPYLLHHPQCRFLVRHQDKTIFDLAPNTNFLTRAAEVLNLNVDHLTELKHDQPEQNLKVHLILGDINIARSRRDMQFIFVNGRPVQNKTIFYHMNEVYRLILPPKCFPFFALFVRYPAEDIDVNIHPTKREIKIREEQYLAMFIRQLTEQVLMTGNAKKVATSPGSPAAPESDGTDFTQPAQDFIRRALNETARPASSFDQLIPPEFFDEKLPHKQPLTEQYAFPEMGHLLPARDNAPAGTREALRGKLEHGRYIGVFINKFLLFESGRSLLVVDQHAAQERITFEQFILQMEKGRVEVQHLLSPYLIKLSPQDLNSWEETQDVLESCGFSSSQFDGETIAVHTYPALLKDPARAVREILAGETVGRTDHATIARRACRASIMAGDALNDEQADFQRVQLLKCADPFTCPHGRPTVIEMTEGFLDKEFLRT